MNEPESGGAFFATLRADIRKVLADANAFVTVAGIRNQCPGDRSIDQVVRAIEAMEADGELDRGSFNNGKIPAFKLAGVKVAGTELDPPPAAAVPTVPEVPREVLEQTARALTKPAVSPAKSPERQSMPKPTTGKTRERIHALLAKGPLTAGQIQEKLELGDGLVGFHLKSLAGEGRVERVDPASRLSPWRQRVAGDAGTPGAAPAKSRAPKQRGNGRGGKKPAPTRRGDANGLEDALRSLENRLTMQPVEELPNKVACLDRLATLAPKAVSELLVEIREDLVRLGRGASA